MSTAQDPLSLLEATCREIEADIQAKTSVWVFIVEIGRNKHEHDLESPYEANCTDKTEARGVAELLLCQWGGTSVSFFCRNNEKKIYELRPSREADF